MAPGAKSKQPKANAAGSTLFVEIDGGVPGRVGYARVSTVDQSLDAQLDALSAARCGRVYFDKASGAKDSRPAIDGLRAHLRDGDTVVVTKLDRLGRSMVDLVNTLDAWCQQGVSFVAVEQGIDTSTAAGRMVCSMLAAVAEFELAMNHERTAKALHARKVRGIKGGRPSLVTVESLAKAERLLDAGIPLVEAAAAIGVSRSTLGFHRARAKEKAAK